jgi:hypothetical protein
MMKFTFFIDMTALFFLYLCAHYLEGRFAIVSKPKEIPIPQGLASLETDIQLLNQNQNQAGDIPALRVHDQT